MTAVSNYLENKLLDHVFRNISYTPPTSCYVALFNQNASVAQVEQGTLTNEVSGGSYVRKLVTFGAPVNGVITNTASLDWTNMPTTTVTYVAIMDTLGVGTGNVLWGGELDTPIPLVLGNNYTISASTLVVVLD